MLRELGWVRLLYSSRLQQLGVGNLTGHTDDCGKDKRKTNENNTEVCMADTRQHTQINIVLPPPPTEPGPQVPPQDGTLSGVWTTGQPLDVWRAFSDRGNSGKCL